MNKQFLVSKYLFRILLIGYVALGAMRLLIGSLPSGYSSNLRIAFEAEPPTWLLSHAWFSVPLLISMLALLALSLIGLYFFRNWGRTLAIYSTLAGIAIDLAIGPVLWSPMESAISESATLLWGAILAVAYSSSIASQFKTDRQRS